MKNCSLPDSLTKYTTVLYVAVDTVFLNIVFDRYFVCMCVPGIFFFLFLFWYGQYVFFHV